MYLSGRQSCGHQRQRHPTSPRHIHQPEDYDTFFSHYIVLITKKKSFFQRRHIEHTDYVCSRGIPHRATVGVAAKSTIASQKPRASPFGPAQASQHFFPIVYQKVYLSAILKVHRMQNDTVLQTLVSCAILGPTLRLTLGLSYQWLFRPGVA